MRRLRLPAAIGLWLAFAGCGGGAAVDRTPVLPPCGTRVLAANPGDSLTVALFDTVDLSHAPWGRNREERFVFSHLYETLVTIDCHGDVQPGLAKSWRRSSDGWLLTLRDDAHFWDESAVTAKDVAASFEPAIQMGLAIGSVDPVSENEILISRPGAAVDLKLLALPMLSVTKKDGDTTIGTAPWEIADGSSVSVIMIRPASGDTPVVRFVQRDVRDALDFLGSGADAMITDDPDAIEYARSKHASLAPLAWDRAYVLLSRERTLRVIHGATLPKLPAALCDALARDAVRVDARGGSGLLLEAERAGCPAFSVDPAPEEVVINQRRILFPIGDSSARGLAERIVALAAMDTVSTPEARSIVRAVPSAGPGMRVEGVTEDELEAKLASFNWNESTYVIPLSWCTDFPCPDERMRERAPWLLVNGIQLSRTVVPLVETRAHFVVITDRVSFADDGASNVRLLIPTPRRMQ